MSFIWNGDWPRLQALRLNNIKTSTIGLWNRSHWEGMRYLNLHRMEINDEGAADVARGSWPLLSLLNLKGNRISSAGASALASGNWPKL